MAAVPPFRHRATRATRLPSLTCRLPRANPHRCDESIQRITREGKMTVEDKQEARLCLLQHQSKNPQSGARPAYDFSTIVPSPTTVTLEDGKRYIFGRQPNQWRVKDETFTEENTRRVQLRLGMASKYLSRVMAFMFKKGQKWTIQSLSAFGVYVNEREARSEVAVKNGDIICFGFLKNDMFTPMRFVFLDGSCSCDEDTMGFNGVVGESGFPDSSIPLIAFQRLEEIVEEKLSSHMLQLEMNLKDVIIHQVDTSLRHNRTASNILQENQASVEQALISQLEGLKQSFGEISNQVQRLGSEQRGSKSLATDSADSVGTQLSVLAKKLTLLFQAVAEGSKRTEECNMGSRGVSDRLQTICDKLETVARSDRLEVFDQARKHLFCDLCKQQLMKAAVLRCGHSFCVKCLSVKIQQQWQLLRKGGSNIVCPTCRAIVLDGTSLQAAELDSSQVVKKRKTEEEFVLYNECQALDDITRTFQR